MQFLQTTLTFIVSIAFAVFAQAQNVSIPEFELLFSGPMSFGPTFYVDGPFGMRQDGSIFGYAPMSRSPRLRIVADHLSRTHTAET